MKQIVKTISIFSVVLLNFSCRQESLIKESSIKGDLPRFWDYETEIMD